MFIEGIKLFHQDLIFYYQTNILLSCLLINNLHTKKMFGVIQYFFILQKELCIVDHFKIKS